MLYKRDLIEAIEPFLKRKEFIAIIGPRQSGKTTFLEILTEYIRSELKVNENLVSYVTFEDRKLLAQFEQDPVAFVKSFMPPEGALPFYLMMDEFQYADEGGQKLKLIYDTIKNVKVIITGSSSLDIKAQVGKYMVGRALSFHLYPFNFGECLESKNKRAEKIYRERNELIMRWLFDKKPRNIKRGRDIFFEEFVKPYEEFCLWGGYPAVAISNDYRERKKLLSDIYNDYILKDIKTLLELATEKNLYLLSQYLSTQIGSIVVYQNLCQAAGLDHRNMKKHLTILEETFIVRQVRPFFSNPQKELSKNPKVFFVDMGFRNNLIENMNAFEKRTDAGAVVENSVFCRLNELCEGMEKIRFWRTKAGAEVDFVLGVQGGNVPVEVKYSCFDRENPPRGMLSFIDSFSPERALVLTKNFWGIAKRDKTEILFAPVYYL